MAVLNKHIRNVLKCQLVLLFIGYYISSTMFYHAHLVNGYLLSHSHPYKRDKNNKYPYESHSHSSQAYSYIQQLNEASWKDTASVVEITSPVISHFECIVLYNTPFVKATTFSVSLLRAPPVTC